MQSNLKDKDLFNYIKKYTVKRNHFYLTKKS